MADNVVVSAGTGTTVAADEVVDGTLGTVKVQYVKIMDATLDGTTKAAVGAGGLKVDPTSSVAMNTGVRSATTQRVTVATDDNVPVTLTAETTKVIGTVNNAAGTNLMGKVGIDQTTDGTTNKVAADVRLGGVAADKGVGTGGSATQRMAIDSSQVTPSGTLAPGAAPAGAIATLGQYNATNPAPTDTQTVALQLDPNGKLLVAPYGNPANFVSGAITTAMTGTTTTSLVAAPAAGLRNYITTIICSNSHATVGTDIIIQDGSGGTTLLTIPAAAVYGGAVITLPTPLRQPTTATAIFCANVTTGASTKVSAVGYKGA